MLRTCKPHFFWNESIPAQVRAKINEHTMKVFSTKEENSLTSLKSFPRAVESVLDSSKAELSLEFKPTLS